MPNDFYQPPEKNYNKLNKIGGWLLLIIMRLIFAMGNAVLAMCVADKQVVTTYLWLFIGICLSALTVLVLMLLKKRAFRIAYIVFAFFCLMNYFVVENLNGFVACMFVEAAWICYLFLSVRVKLILGLTKPDMDSNK